jgi:glutamate synthase domain-containing protein 2
MSFGSLSAPAVQALGIGAKESGCWMNTGEGGISPYHIESGADLVVQIGTAHYSMRNEDGTLDFDKLKSIAQIESVKMFELKLSQGAKPGKGGILPAKKITKEIAEIRGIPVGVDSISPNRHMEAPNDEGLLELIAKIRNVTNKPCGIKMCLGNIEEFETLVSKIDVKNGPDFITIDGGEGGTGASPASLIDYVGMPLFKALPLVHDALKQAKLRDSIEIIASGKLITPEKVAGALAYGADFVVSARGFMMSLGCIQALHCNDNTCPTGITTQDEDLQKNLIVPYRAERVKNYINNMEYEVGVIAHSCGCKHPRDLNLGHIL